MDAPYVIYEDNHLLVVFKPQGYLSQGDGSDAPDVLTFFKAYLKEKYNKPGNVYLGLVHRLDRNVAGVMVLAKTSKCASRLSEQIRNGKFQKTYMALAEGLIEGEGKIVNYLIKDQENKKAIVYDTKVTGSKRSELLYEALSFDGSYSKVRVTLITGRFHQIRASFAHMGHPLRGDIKYGGKKSSEGLGLYAYSVSFAHPVTREIQNFSCSP